MVATQGAPSAAGGWGAWGHIGRGLRSTLRPSSGREDNGPGSDGPDVSGTPGLGARGDARRRWGARRPVGRVGVTSTEPAGASGVDRTGETGVASRSDATARGVRRSGSPRSLPILSVSRAHARDVATLAGTARSLDVRPSEETRGETRKKDLADDDILDAIATLWTAHRIEAGTSESLPTSPPHDATGLPMRIVF